MNSPGPPVPAAPGGDANSSYWPAAAQAAAAPAPAPGSTCMDSPVPSAPAGSSCGSSPAKGPTWTSSIWNKARSFTSLVDGAVLLSPLTTAADVGSEYSYPMSNFDVPEPLSEPAAAAAASAAAALPAGSTASEPPTPQGWRGQPGQLQHSSSYPHLAAPGPQAPAAFTAVTATSGAQLYQAQLQQQVPQGHPWLQQAAVPPMLLAQPQPQQAAATAAAAGYYAATTPQQLSGVAQFQLVQQQLAAQAALQQQQLHLQAHLQLQQQQQVQMVPVQMQYVPAGMAPAAAAAGMGFFAPCGAAVEPRPVDVPLRQRANGQSAWQLVWEAAASRVAASTSLQQQATASTAAGPAAAAAGSASGLVLAPVAAVASTAAAALMCVLVAAVACLLALKLRVQNTCARVCAVASAAAGFASSTADAFREAAAEVAGASGVEELAALMRQQQKHKQQQQHQQQQQLAVGDGDGTTAADRTSTSGLRQRLRGQQAAATSARPEQGAPPPVTDVTAAATPAPGGDAGGSGTSSSRGSHYTQRCLEGVGDLVTALGLWSGLLVWVSRWLVLQAPAATRQAVSDSWGQGRSAAEAAAAAVFEHVFCLLYGLVWTVARQLHIVGTCVGQRLCTACTAVAQRLCCLGLLLVALLSGDAGRQRSAVQVVVVAGAQAIGGAVGRVVRVWGGVAEALAAAVTAQLLKEASPVTQTAVWGLANMLKRNLLESWQLGWQLLLQLSQVYVATQAKAAQGQQA